MARFNAGASITVTQSGTVVHVMSVTFSPDAKSVTIVVRVPGVGVREHVLAGADMQAFCATTPAPGTTLRHALHKAVRGALATVYGTTMTPPAGAGIDDDFA